MLVIQDRCAQQFRRNSHLKRNFQVLIFPRILFVKSRTFLGQVSKDSPLDDVLFLA